MTNDSLFTVDAFDHSMRLAEIYASSNMVPQRYQKNLGNVLVAMEIANKFKITPIMAMQHIQVFEDGNLGISSPLIISLINSCGRFELLKFTVTGEGDAMSCVAWTRHTGVADIIEGPIVSIKMAKEEGWYAAEGSKWPTMPELMLRYRAAAFFSRVHCPDITLGMHSREEVIDIHAVKKTKIAATGSDITVSDLRVLVESKKHLFTAEELTHMYRIIDRNEVTSFKKVQTLLNSKS